MSDYKSNIWLIDESEFEQFTFTGGKVIYIAEDIPPIFKTHPSIITAGALLPTVEAIRAELDGNIDASVAMYERYLVSEEADIYISIILAASIKQIPVAIMFGRDESNMQFPKMLINFLYKYHGIVIGIQNKVMPFILEQYMPYNLAKLYCMNIIDYKTFMEVHPNLPINPMVISKMAIEVNPFVYEKNMQGYMEYFEQIKNDTISNNRNITIDPVVPSQ